MGFLDKLKLKKGDQADADAAPSGPTPVAPVAGDLKGNGAASATVLKKGNIIAAAVIGAVVVAAASDYVYNLHESGQQQHESRIKPAGGPTDINVPHVAPPLVAPALPTAAGASGASQQTAASMGTAPAAPAPSGQPVQPAQPTPQQLAFEAAVHGGSGGAGTVSWQTAGVGAPAQPGEGAAPGIGAAQPTALPKPKNSVYSTTLVRREVSPFELLQGTVIPATLETGIKSDLPGEITAVVSQPVYNSVSGSVVLVPAGSKLVGTYQSKIMAGATRVGVAWTRILFPNGTYLNLGGMQGADAGGYAGFHDLVNDHTWTVFKNALLLSLIDVGMSVASPTSAMTATGGVTGNMALQDGEQSLAQTFGQAEAQMMQRSINVAPTITIRPGYAFNVMVTKDLVFPGPYRHGNQIAQTAPASAAAPTIANPYG